MKMLKTLRHQIRLLNKQLLIYWVAITKPHHKLQKFIILAQGRTGSSLLKEVLNSHPNIHCDDEMLNPAYNFAKGNLFFPKLFLQGLSQKHLDKLYGCKIKPKHLLQQRRIRDEQSYLLELIKEGWKIIYLYRSNVLHHALSNIVAEERGKYHLRKGEKNTLNLIHVSIDRLQSGMQSRARQLEEEKVFLESISFLELNYEKDLLHNPQIGADKVFAYLGVSSVPVKTDLVKVVNTDLEKFLENYDALLKAFKGTTFEAYFYEKM